jgi:hypothetical protein
MSRFSVLHKHRLRLGLLAALLATIVAGLFAVAGAQSNQPGICATINDIRVCGNQISGEVTDESFKISGDVLTIHYKDASSPSLRVLPMLQFNPNIAPNDPLRQPVFERHANPQLTGGAEYTLKGDIHFVEKDGSLGGNLASSRFLGDNTTTPTTAGFFRVDTINMLIFNADTPTPTEANAGLPRNSLVQFDLFQRAGLSSMLARATPADLATIDMEINLPGSFVFIGVELPQALVVPTVRDVNPKVEIDFRMTLAGALLGQPVIEGVQFRAGGVLGRIGGARIIPEVDPRNAPDLIGPQQSGDKPINFEAEVLEFSRVDNPDLPNLDASQPDLVFSIQGVQYKDGRFSVRGGAVGLPDWQVSRAFKLSGQRVSLVTDAARTSTTMIISSTLSFPSGSVATDARTFPMAIRVSARELPGGKITTAMTGTLLTAARPALDLGPLSISTPAKTELVFDPAANFFGIKAEQVSLKWDSGLGGGSGVQSGLKLGVDKNKNLVFALGAGGGITLPTMRSQALTLQVSGNIANTNDLTTFTLNGKAQLALPGNAGVSPNVTMVIRSGKDVFDVAVCPPKIRCLKRFEWQLTSFELKVAGFGLGIGGAQGTGDGGFQVGTASLKVPLGIKSIAGSVNGLKVAGNGNISLTGGSVELPPMQVGSFSLVGVKGSFVKTTTGYEFKGAGTVPLPGLEPNSGKKLSGEVIIRTRFDGSFQGFGVSVQFDTGSPGIPIANTGMELTMLKGSFDVNSSTVKIAVGMRASSQIRFGPVPAATAEGNAQVQFSPFQLTANAKLSVLVLQVAQASIGVGHQQGFAGGPGFNVAFDINFILTRGETKLRIGPVTLSNGQRKTVIAAEAAYTVGIKRSAIFTLMPPADITVARLEFKGGTFTVKGKSETLGLLGRVKVNIPIPFVPDPTLSVFVDLQSKKVDVTDTDDYKLIDATALRAQAAQGVAGFSSRRLSQAEAEVLGLASAQALAPTQLLQETLPVVLDRPGLAVLGISYPPGGAPALRLELPDGTVVTEQNAAEHKGAFLRYTDSVTEPHELAFVLAEAQPGSYRLIVDSAPASYETVSYMFNDEPIIDDVSVTCGGAPIPGVSVQCDGAEGGSEATIRWTMQDRDSPGATVSVAYAPLLLGVDGARPDLSQLTLLAEGLPQGAGSFSWQLGDVPTGSYALVVRAGDGQNAPVELAAATAIGIDDKRAPAAPAGLAAEPLPGELLLRWQPNAERDLAGYEIGFGVVQPGVADSPDAFVYSRDMGAKETSAEASDLYDAKLWGLADDQEVFVGIRAYDRSGNKGEWALLRARPWALAPDAWTPAPDTSLPMTAAVEVAFAAPLGLDLAQPVPAELLTLLRADGSPVAGRLEVLTNLDGDAAVGLRFVPEAALRGGERYTAVLKGGAGGIASADGRQMAQDYRWSFLAEQQQLYLSLIGN